MFEVGGGGVHPREVVKMLLTQSISSQVQKIRRLCRLLFYLREMCALSMLLWCYVMHSVLRNLKKSLIFGHLATPADTYASDFVTSAAFIALFSFLFLSTSVFCLASRILSWPWDWESMYLWKKCKEILHRCIYLLSLHKTNLFNISCIGLVTQMMDFLGGFSHKRILLV